MARAPPERAALRGGARLEVPRAGVGFRKYRPGPPRGGVAGVPRRRVIVLHKGSVYTGLAVGVEASTEWTSGDGSSRCRGSRSLRTSSATMTWPSSTVGGRLFDDCRKRIAAAPMRMPAVNTHPTVKPAPSTWSPSEAPRELDDDAAAASPSSSAFFLAPSAYQSSASSSKPQKVMSSSLFRRFRHSFILKQTSPSALSRTVYFGHWHAGTHCSVQTSSDFSPQTFSQAVPQSNQTLSPAHAWLAS
mmetsp:Transcript_9667/g.28269  ORF Transcript_9667/g.28269 Transcript_9667/m.28269 type:complete len:246 (+) Transcript_9667:2007-2744(+)